MELRHLRHFLAVAETLHMGRAARDLGMAQPPLSQSIARLEKELGVRLFERANRRLTLTRAGAAFSEEARASVMHADAAIALAKAGAEGAAGAAGEVRIGFVSAALYTRLPNFLRPLRETYPSIRPTLFELSTNEQLSALAESVIDIGFVHPPLGATQPLDVLELPGEELVAVMPEDGRSDGVTLARIAECGLILFPADQGPVLHAGILDGFRRAGIDVRIAQEATQALTMLSLVSAGLGAALLPASTRNVLFRGARYASILDASLPALSLALVARRRPRPAVIDRMWRTALDSLD